MLVFSRHFFLLKEWVAKNDHKKECQVQKLGKSAFVHKRLLKAQLKIKKMNAFSWK